MKNVLRDTLTFTQTVEIKSERIEDLLVTALEGGSNHWLCLSSEELKNNAEKLKGETKAYRQIMLGATLSVFDVEEPDHKLGDLNAITIVSALQAMANGEDLKGKKNDHLKTHFNNFVSENDDAETADVVVQIAVLGEIVYG